MFSGCISSILKEPAPTFSKEARLQSPPSPFVKMKSASYPSWKSSKTQNVILILSNCDSLYNVNNIHHAIAENVDNVKVESSQVDSLKFVRPVVKQIQGSIDNAPVTVKTVAFQHRNCTYLTALSGKPETLSSDLENWKNFINSIEFTK